LGYVVLIKTAMRPPEKRKKNMKHKHHAVKSVDYGFSRPVSENENRAAHGNICRVDTCSCGATRRTNINGSHIERGVWATAKVQATINQQTGKWTVEAK
jgi:hypothetical protein